MALRSISERDPTGLRAPLIRLSCAGSEWDVAQYIQGVNEGIPTRCVKFPPWLSLGTEQGTSLFLDLKSTWMLEVRSLGEDVAIS